ncbi:integrase [Methanobrevibacter ruminantium]|uniref:integrase n=1 Tax=Methanobrevibacter ruminantium TaxID=83816 RepID=UPI003EFD2696
MLSKDLFEVFCSNRNIKDSTIKSYRSAILKYESFHKVAIKDLIGEAMMDEENMVPLKNRHIKNRLLNFRSYLLDSELSINTVKTYFSRIKTFYRHFEIELPYLNDIKFDGEYLSSYYDLPARGDIRKVCSISSNAFRALVLFISSSGCAKVETLSLTVGDFVKAIDEYHDGGSIDDVLNCLIGRRDIVPAFYLKRIKTNKFYYAFCSPEASHHIVKYLISRKGLSLDDRLFDFTDSSLIYSFKKVNDKLNMGFVGRYRFFRSHALRKFHASNIGLSAVIVDELQGRGKSKVREAYMKTNPIKLKEIYMGAMHNVMVFDDWIGECEKEDDCVIIENQVINVIINFSLDGMDYRVE